MSEEESIPKKPKLNHGAELNRNPIAISAPSDEQSQPKIFKLDIDCFDEIFEYLSVKDLHSFGQTCKTMQQVAGEYFKRNYSAAETSIEDDIYINYSDNDVINQRTVISGFYQFITRTKYHNRDIETLNYIRRHFKEFNSIRHVRLKNQIFFDETQDDCLVMIWPKVETGLLEYCWIYGDLHENLLVHCKNLKCLNLYTTVWPKPDCRVGVPWYRRQYPKLEHLGVNGIHSIDGIIEFLQNNPNIKSFAIGNRWIELYWQQLMQTNVQLDLLRVESLYRPDIDMASILRQLHEQGFYKRLHYNTISASHEFSKRLASLPVLESLCIKGFSETFNLSQLTDLRELSIETAANAKDMEIIAKSLVNLQRVYIGNATIDDVLPFICHAPKLTKIKVIPKNEAHFNGGVLKLQTLNKEREKLNRAQKVTIYVPDNIFLKTKWATKNGETNLSLIEIKRLDSYEWDPSFY